MLQRLQSGALGSGEKDTEMAEPGNIGKPKNEKLVPEAVALSAKVAVQCKQVLILQFSESLCKSGLLQP